MRDKGFTLTEVLIVIVILGVVTGVAIPSYMNQMEQSRANEAKIDLNTIYMAEKVFMLKNGVYWPPSGTNSNISQINQALGIELETQPQRRFYTISVSRLAGSAAFRARATRKAISVYTSGGQFAQIDQTGVLDLSKMVNQ